MTKKYKLAALLLILIVIIAAVGVYGIREILEDESYIIISFDNDITYSFQEHLNSLGPRLAGTDAEYQCAVYIKSQFEKAGLSEVRIHAYEKLLYEVNYASVSLVEYGPLGIYPNFLEDPIQYAHTIDFVVQGYSGSLEWSGYSDDMEIVDLEDGKNDGLWEDAAGCAGIVNQATGIASNTELFFKAKDYGLGALILHNTNYGKELGYVPFSKSTGIRSGEKEHPNIPFFMVSKNMGDELLEGMNSDMKLRVDFDVTVEERDTYVVMGDVKGTDNPKKYVMLGAHHDTVYNGDGAVDNTAGTVTVIELAQQLAKYKPKRTIRLATWGGEEEGLLGSKAWFNAHKENVLNNCMMYLNFDMNNVNLRRGNDLPLTVSDNTTLRHMQDITYQLRKKALELEKYDISIEYYDLSKIGSDHLPFTNNGIRTAAALGSGSWEYHTYLDTIEHVNVESLSIGGRIFGSYALYLANK